MGKKCRISLSKASFILAASRTTSLNSSDKISKRDGIVCFSDHWLALAISLD